MCKYHTPSGFTLQSSRVTTDPNGEKTYVAIDTKTNDTNPIYLATFTLPKDGSWQPTINECSLKWCGKVYSGARFLNGTLFADPTQEVPLTVLPSTRTSNLASRNSLPELSSLTPPPDFPNETTFQLHAPGVEATQNFLSQIFKGDLRMAPGVSSASQQNDYIMFQLYNRNDMPGTLASIANSMTDYLRYGRNQSLAGGVAYMDQQYVHIDWPWLLLPVFLICSGAAMLGASIALTQHSKTLPWKGSSLPFFFQQELGTLRYREVEDRAEHTHGRFEGGLEGRLAFVSRTSEAAPLTGRASFAQ